MSHHAVNANCKARNKRGSCLYVVGLQGPDKEFVRRTKAVARDDPTFEQLGLVRHAPKAFAIQ